MSRYLNFEKEELGYESLYPSRDNFKSNIGKKICYVNKRSIDKYRGYFSVDYGVIEHIRYSQLYFENGREIDIRDIAECGIIIA